MSKLKSLSIVIPSYKFKDPESVISRLLDLEPLEIIVADSSPSPPKLPEDERVRLVRLTERAFPGKARNEGARVAKGDYLLFVDADVEFSLAGVSFVKSFLEKDSDEIVFGIYERDHFNFVTQLQVDIQRYRFTKAFRLEPVPYGQSSHMIIKRKNYWQIGGMDPNLRMREDTEFCIRGKCLGFESSVYEEFTAVHTKRFNLWTLIKDYLHRTYCAIEVINRQPGIFTRTSGLMSNRYKLTWILGALMPFVWAFGLGFNIDIIWLAFSSIMILVLPVALCYEVMGNYGALEKIKAALVWPFIGASLVYSSVFAIFKTRLVNLLVRLRELMDWVVLTYRVFRRNGWPLHIINFITSRCNLRCNHCFYKETLDKKDTGEQNLQRMSNTSKEIGPLLWYAFAGGEPFLRKDIDLLHKEVDKNCRPKILTIPTNGWFTDAIFEKTLRILQQLRNRTLILQFSIDGPEEMHDSIRSKSSFSRLKYTFERIKPLQQLYPNLNLAVITCVTEDNYQIFPAFVDEILSEFDLNQLNINLVRGEDLSAPPLPAEVLEAYKKAVDRYEWHINQGNVNVFSFLGKRLMRLKEVMQKELIYEVAKENKFVTPCTAGNLNYVIWEDGRVAPCEMLHEPIGRLEKEESFREIVTSKKAKDLRSHIVKSQCKCTYECAMSANCFFSYPMMRKMMLRFFSGGLLGSYPKSRLKSSISSIK